MMRAFLALGSSGVLYHSNFADYSSNILKHKDDISAWELCKSLSAIDAYQYKLTEISVLDAE
jgi:hypothetical protein